jgi:hypothetical protein
MRGKQLGAAIDARVLSAPLEADWRWADVAVLIKRAGAQYSSTARQYKVPIVWDAVDFWAQPFENTADESRALALLRAQVNHIRPAVTIGATAAMAEACGGVYLPHHTWRGLEPVRIREQVQVVCYQGNPVYLGRWRAALVLACARRGWLFATEPDELWKADILVAFRDGPWDGWMCREWKSGVKLANAIAAGRPVVTQNSAAWREVAPPGWAIETPDQLDAVFDVLGQQETRLAALETCRGLAPAYRLPAVAEQFRAILSAAVTSPCPA